MFKCIKSLLFGSTTNALVASESLRSSDPASPPEEPGLQIVGLGSQFPAHTLGPEDVRQLADRHYKARYNQALRRVFQISRSTGIDARSAVVPIDHPVHNGTAPAPVDELHKLFTDHGIPLATGACSKAIQEWGGKASDITHVVSATCTDSANPGFDHAVIKKLGINAGVEKVLLCGVGCSGGLATLRTAANLAQGYAYRKRPARILCIAVEVTSIFHRAELDSIIENNEVRIGVCLFGDGAGAAIVSNGIGLQPKENRRGLYDMEDWKHSVIPDSTSALGFDLYPFGWKVVLTPAVPQFVLASVRPTFDSLIREMKLRKQARTDQRDDRMTPESYQLPEPSDFDWALHPGGRAIIDAVQTSLALTPDHLQATNTVYKKHGNASSATNLIVIDELRKIDGGRKRVAALSFGPGIAVEMMLLRRRDLAA